MMPSEIRAELVEQHEALRALAREARGAAEHVGHDAHGADEVRWRLSAVLEALAAHNAREEALLDDVIPTVDAWGAVRASLMTMRHREEHEALRAALRDARDATAEIAAALGRTAIDRVLVHMAEEEREILAANVLRDDLCAIDATDG
jgi:hypothetical protein